MATTPKKNDTFETAIKRLEEIVALMETDDMSLDTLLERYEEGNTLIGFCQEKLKSAEQRIEMVTRKAVEPTPENSPAPISKNDPDVSLF